MTQPLPLGPSSFPYNLFSLQDRNWASSNYLWLKNQKSAAPTEAATECEKSELITDTLMRPWEGGLPNSGCVRVPNPYVDGIVHYYKTQPNSTMARNVLHAHTGQVGWMSARRPWRAPSTPGRGGLGDGPGWF